MRHSLKCFTRGALPLLALACLAAQSGAALRQDLERKARDNRLDLEALQRQYAAQLQAESGIRTPGPPADADQELYAGYKLRGEPIPAWLRERVFPRAGRTWLAERDGGDGPAAATPITTVAWGDCYTDQGTTVDKSDNLPNPIALPPAQCDFGIFEWTSFSATDSWYTFTLQTASQITVNTCLANTFYDTAIAILDVNLVPVSADEDIPFCDFGAWRSWLECCLEPGVYYLVIDGYDAFAVGDYEVEACFAECPPDPCIGYSEDIAQATVPGTLSGDNTEGHDILGHDGQNEVGFDLDTGEGGIYTFDPCHENTAADLTLYLFDQDPCAGGTLIASSTWGNCDLGNPWAATLSNVILPAGGAHLVVSSNSQMGAFQITAFSPCEDYNEAVDHLTAPAVFFGNNSGGVNVYSGPGGDAGLDVTIESAGFWDFDACYPATTFDVSLYLFDANPCLGGQLLAESVWSNCQEPWSAGRLRDVWLEPGVYHLMASNSWMNTGDYEIHIQPTPPRPTSGGPDEYGYRWRNDQDPAGPTFEWVEISQVGTPLDFWNSPFVGPLDMGITFPFYDAIWTECFVSSNGFVSFGAGYFSWGNQPIPTLSDGWSPDNFVAMLWTDFDLGAGGQVYAWSDPAHARYIVEYEHVVTISGSQPMTFEIILHANADVEVLYLDVDESIVGMISAGIENSDGTVGLQYNYAADGGFVGDSTAVYYDALEGDFRPPMISHDNPQQDVETELPGGYVIEAEITDETGIAAAELRYHVNGGAEQSVVMSHVTGDTWRGTLSHQAAGTQVDYLIRAVDSTENGNTRVSPSWFFQVVSFHWPPQGLTASDGLNSQTLISWFPPVNPGLLAHWFGAELPRGEPEAVERLMREHGLFKAEALETWRGLTHPAERQFVEYRVYRDGQLLGVTGELGMIDNAASGSQMDVTYSYTVRAQFSAGESDPSSADTGYWGSPPTFGGPDAFGYLWVNSLHPAGPEFDWVDISGLGQTAALGDDDYAGPFDLGFAFPYYDQFPTEVYIGSNGYLSFGQGYSSLSPMPIPWPSDGWSPDNFIAAFWDDLYPGNGGTVYYYADMANQRFIVQFQDVPGYWQGGPFTFQFILDAGGIITVQYLDLDENDLAWAGAGIENSNGTIGLQYHLQGEGAALGDQVAVLYTPPSSCEPVACAGVLETEPNEGWGDNNASWNMIRCGDTRCGTILAGAAGTDTDWYLYTHFGGNITATLDLSDFNGRVSLRQQALNGQTIASANTFPRCFDEALTVNDLPSGAYYLVVEHAGAPDVNEPQSYNLTLECSGDPCSGHFPIECAGTPEAEPNEGWNADPPNSSFGEIGLNQTVCGTASASGDSRDMDWFHFHLDQPGNVTFSATTDAFDAALFLTQFDPAGSVLAEIDEAPACAPEMLFFPALPAGDYFIVIGHHSFDGVPEPQAYALTFGQGGQPEDPCDNFVDAGNFHDIWTVARPAPINVHHDGTGCPGGINSPGRDEVVRLVLAQSTDLQVTLHGEGLADEVILLLGNCEQPQSSCGAAINAHGVDMDSEVLTLQNVPAGDYYIVADFAGMGETHPYFLSIVDMESDLVDGRPLAFRLEPCRPNPFNPTTTIEWAQPVLARAGLTVHDLRGALVERLDLGVRGAGRHSVVWDASRLGSGVYFYTLSAGEFSRTRKAVLLK